MKTIILTYFISAFSVAGFAQNAKFVSNADIEHEKRLYSEFEIDFGTIKLNPISNDRLYMVNIQFNKDKTKPFIDFDRDGSESTLRFYTKSKGVDGSNTNVDFNIEDDSENNQGDSKVKKSDFTGSIELSKEVDHDLKFSLGAGTADLNLTGLKLTNAEISTGAGQLKIQCNSTNPNVLRDFSIQSGVGAVKAEGLLNLNFKRMKVEGGVGSFDLNFSGNASGKHSVDVQTGIGSVVIKVPKNVGVRITDDSSFFSNLTVPREFKKRGSIYQSANYSDSDTTIEFTISSGMGSVKFVVVN